MNYYKCVSGYAEGFITAIVMAHDEDAAKDKFSWYLKDSYSRTANKNKEFTTDISVVEIPCDYGIMDMGWSM